MNTEDKREIAELLQQQTDVMVKSFQHHVDFLLSGMKSLDDKLALIAADVAAFRSNNSTQRDSRL